MSENYEDTGRTCEKCCNPIYLRKKDGRLVCSVGTEKEFIPLNERCFEPKEIVLEQ